MFRLVLSFGLCICLGTGARSITISGYVKDAHTGEKLIGATIYPLDYNGNVTNNHGFFSLSLPAGKHEVHVSHVGYQSRELVLDLKKDTFILIALTSNNEIEEIQVIAKNPFRIQSRLDPAMKTIPMKLTGNLPVIMGERDILKTLQLMPGVHPGSEGNTGIHVRGAEGSNNLILIDGVEVFNPNHLLGFFSVFNEDAINNVKLYTSGFPAQYNGRLASVTDIRMKDGNNKKFSASGSIGLISSKLLLEGPLVKDKLTCMLSARRTYLDLFAKPMIKKIAEKYNADYYFYDLNGKLKWQVNKKSSFHVSAYKGEDNGLLGNEYINGTSPPSLESAYTRNLREESFHWGNSLIIARYEHAVNEKLFINISASSSIYDYTGKNTDTDSMIYWYRNQLIKQEKKNSYTSNSDINENIASMHAEYFWGKNHTTTSGASVKRYHLVPKVESVNVFQDTNLLSQASNHLILSGYLQDEIKINEVMKIIPGVNINQMLNDPGKIYFDKRLAFIYRAFNSIATSISYSETTQYLHLLSLSRISLASDTWLMADDKISPSKAWDISFSIGFEPFPGWNISTSLYQREYNGLLLYKEGASYRKEVNTFEELITSGSGKSKGAELLIEKSQGRIKGFVSYSLSTAYRKFPAINEGDKFPARYNRPHIFYLAGTLDMGKKWKMGIVFNLMSGSMQSYSPARYTSWFDIGEPLQDDIFNNPNIGLDILVYKRNAYRLPVYHRLDISFSYNFNTRHVNHNLHFGFYNAYNAKNSYSIEQIYTFVGYSGTPPVENSFYRLEQKSLFLIVPFINYNFTF